MKQVVSTPNAPTAIGAYSQAIVHNGLVFVSGQVPFNPETGVMVDGDIASQTDRVLKNVKAILEAAGSSLSQVLKTTVFLKDMGDFQQMNEVYGRYFTELKPARSTIQAARLPRDVHIEIDAIAFVE